MRALNMPILISLKVDQAVPALIVPVATLMASADMAPITVHQKRQ